MDCIYDYPLYYDVLCGWDRDAEASFYDAALRRHGVRPGGKLVEIACGTGQIAIRMASLGWEVTGLDVRQGMLDFLRQRARSFGLDVETVCADMIQFALPEAQHGAVCPIGSFAVLQDDASALSHLAAMAVALRPDGVYILDLGLGEKDQQWEEWSIQRDGTRVAARGRKVVVQDAGRDVTLALDWGCRLRRYSGEQFVALVERSGAFTVEAWYPEAARDEDGVSLFSLQLARHAPPTGRAMAALKRRG